MLCNRKGKPRALKKCAATWMALDHSFWASLETEVLTSQSYGFWVENLGKHSPIPWVVRVLESILGHGSKRQFTSWKSKWGFDHNFTTEPSNFSTDLIGNLMPGQLGQGLASAQLSLPCLYAPGALLVCEHRTCTWRGVLGEPEINQDRSKLSG